MLQSANADLLPYFDEALFCRAVTDQVDTAKVAIETSSMNIDFFKEDDSIFEMSAAHVDTLKGATDQHFNKVCQISHDDAKR